MKLNMPRTKYKIVEIPSLRPGDIITYEDFESFGIVEKVVLKGQPNPTGMDAGSNQVWCTWSREGYPKRSTYTKHASWQYLDTFTEIFLVKKADNKELKEFEKLWV